jgi:hypothetical protein
LLFIVGFLPFIDFHSNVSLYPWVETLLSQPEMEKVDPNDSATVPAYTKIRKNMQL